jgi:hypothetical protein
MVADMTSIEFSPARTVRPASVVRRNFEAHARGDVTAWRAGWHDDAVWHVTGSNPFAGDMGIDDYAELVEAAVYANSSYEGEPVGLSEFGEIVVVTWASRGSIGDIELDGQGGLMIYRVVDGKVAEGWAIPAGSGGALPF